MCNHCKTYHSLKLQWQALDDEARSLYRMRVPAEDEISRLVYGAAMLAYSALDRHMHPHMEQEPLPEMEASQ